MDERAELVAGFRWLADFFEQHQEVGLPLSTDCTVFANKATSKQEARTFHRAVGGRLDKIFDDSVMHMTYRVSNLLNLRFMAYREDVCERVVVGTKIIPATEERVIPAEPERQEDLVEWHCGAITNTDALPVGQEITVDVVPVPKEGA